MSYDKLAEKQEYKKQLKKALRDAEFGSEAELKMTSLMDIFVNVLIYLLMNYSTSPVDVQQTEDRKLPKSTTKIAVKDAITIGVTKKMILVNKKRVCEVQDGSVDASYKKDKKADSYVIMPLFKALKDAANKAKKLSRRNSSIKFKGEVMIVADRNMPFRLLAEVMYTAGQAEYGKYRFAVIRSGG